MMRGDHLLGGVRLMLHLIRLVGVDRIAQDRRIGLQGFAQDLNDLGPLFRRELRAERQPAERQRSHTDTDQQATQETVAEGNSTTAHKTCDGHHGAGQLAAASATPIRAGNRQIITRRRGLRNVRVQQTLVRRLAN